MATPKGMNARSAQDSPPTKSSSNRLADMEYITLKKLANLMDIPGDKNWRGLIEAMPSCRYDRLTVERFGMNASKPDGSPAYAMLMDMGNRGVTFKELVAALKRMQFDLALQEIGYQESVKITQQPDATPGVEGQKLVLECKATGVPAPSFMWFKDPRAPLPDQTSDTLVIPKLRREDAGKYCCRAQNGVNVVFSAWVEVKVLKPSILQAGSMPATEDLLVSPRILMEPPREVKLMVGDELRIYVEVAGQPGEKFSFQWSCNGKNLPYVTSNVLYQKQVKLEDQGSYFCRIRSEQGGSSLTDGTQVIVIDPMQPQQVSGMMIPTPVHLGHSDTPLSQMPPPQSRLSHMNGSAPPPMQQPVMMPSAQMSQLHGQQTPMSQMTNMVHQMSISQTPVSPPTHVHPSQDEAQYMDPAYNMALHQGPPQNFPFSEVDPGRTGSNGYPDVAEVNGLPQQNYYQEDIMYDHHQVLPHMGMPGDPHTPIGVEGVGMFPPHRQQQQQQQQQQQHTGIIEDGYAPDHHAHHTRVGGAQDVSGYSQQHHLYTETSTDDNCGPGGQGQLPDLDDSCYDKVALLIGNKHYERDNLKLNTPENDTQDMAGVLLSAGFKVVSLVNLNKIEMEMAVKYFETLIGKNVYAMFFFAGHGFEHNSKNYMMPVDADVEKNPEQCICAQQVLHTMQAKGAKLSIVLLDMCRINASSANVPSAMDLYPNPRGSNGYFVIGFSCSPMERAYEAGAGQELKEEDRDNSIFVSAFKRHLQSGSLKERLDTLLTDAAAVVRERGKDFRTPLSSWQKPEIRHNLGEKLSLADPIKNDYELDSLRRERALLWQSAHCVPETIVVGCEGVPDYDIRSGELALRLHFEAEHSNVLLVTTELLNGSLTACEVQSMEMMLVAGSLQLRCHEDNKQYKYKTNSQFGYGHYQGVKEMDLMHFKIPDLQKINTEKVTLKILVEYQIRHRGVQREVRESRSEILHKMDPPLYAKILGRVRETPSTSPYVQPYTSYTYQQQQQHHPPH